jgi:drug/metabolite transporter (DMT)-like permease
MRERAGERSPGPHRDIELTESNIAVVMGIAFALLAALCNAVSVIERHIASTAADRPAGRQLVGYLLRNPQWLAGWVAQIGAFAFQAVALHLSPLSVVQPLLVTELVIALVLRRVWIHQTVSGAAWTGGAAACAGLAVFIVAAEPRGGNPVPTAGHWAAAIIACAAVIAVLAVAARGGSPARRAALLGTAGGIMWALEATFIKSATDDAAQAGLAGLFTHWSVYAVAVGGMAGVLLEQAALQEGPLRVSQPLLVITDPMVSVALSVWLFGEYFVMSAGVLAAAAAGFVVMCAGVVVLSLAAPATLEADNGPASAARPRSG